MPTEPDLQIELPLSETTFFLLLSLASGPKHGYAIMKEVESVSEGRVAFSTGTLYGAIKRLLEYDWIERTDDPEADTTSRERKAYALTKLGRRILAADVARMRALVKATRHFALETEK